MTINERINQIISYLNISVAAFSREIGVGDQTVRSVCVLQRNKPSFDFLAKIIQTYDWINPDWLLLGTGDMLRSQSDGCHADTALNEKNEELGVLVDYLREKDKKIESLIEEKAIWKYRYDSLASTSSQNKSDTTI